MKTTLTKDFSISKSALAEAYAVPYQMKGSVAYSIFLNDTLLDSGTPKFGSAGNIPFDPELLNEGTNTLKVEIDGNPAGSVLGPNDGCDVAVIAAGAGDIASSLIDENKNILARVTSAPFVH